MPPTATPTRTQGTLDWIMETEPEFAALCEALVHARVNRFKRCDHIRHLGKPCVVFRSHELKFMTNWDGRSFTGPTDATEFILKIAGPELEVEGYRLAQVPVVYPGPWELIAVPIPPG